MDNCGEMLSCTSKTEIVYGSRRGLAVSKRQVTGVGLLPLHTLAAFKDQKRR